MKKLFLIALTAVTLGSSAFAADGKKELNKVGFTVLKNFEAQYADATDVQWTVGAEYTKATFLLDDQKAEAFYNLSGEQIGMSRAIDMQRLPAAALKTIKKNYAGFKVSEAIEFERDGLHAYYVSLTSDNKNQILEISTQGSVSVFTPVK